MYSNLADWDEVFERFELRYPHLVKRMVRWYPSGRDEFTVELEDGNTYVYNYLEERVRVSYASRGDDSEINEDEWLQEFSMRLNRKMRELGINQQRLSEITGLSLVSINRYINARAMPSVYNALLIARALDCSMYELYEF